jgi:hypothetical protein
MSALLELREHLREAARRDIEIERARTRRVRRRGTAFLAAVLLGGAAAATAADLISIGEPVKTRDDQAQYRAVSGGLELVLTADSRGRYPFGAAIYTAANGQRCIIAGQLRGSQLGLVENGTFRPFAKSPADTCGGRGRSFSSRDFGDETIVYGRAKQGTRTIRVDGREHAVGRGESFLFVFDRVPTAHFWKISEE